MFRVSTTPGNTLHAVGIRTKIMSHASKALVRAALEPKTFRYIDQLTNYLHQHFILHAPGRFLIIPKPFGVSCLGRKSEDGGVFKNSVHNMKDSEETLEIPTSSRNDVILEDCIPALAKIFNEPKLHFCTGLKRYLSGAIVLPARVEEAKNIINSMKHINKISNTKDHEDEYHYRCLAILMNTPPGPTGSITGYATFSKVKDHKEYIFVSGKATRREKSGKYAVEGTIDYTVLDSKYGCSLVEFGTNKFARHLPRLAFSSLACPIFGDFLYTQRLIDQGGKPVLINPGQMSKKIKQWFPKQLEERLDKRANELLKFVPLYCHVYQTCFPRYGWAIGKPQKEQDAMDLMASGPPPSHFLAMVEALQMHDALAKFLQEGHNQDDVTVQGDISFA